MEDLNPAKRRKISPSANIPTTDAPRSPSKIPVPARKESQSQDEARSGSMPRRPSFASPTKASLARHNPQIMQRVGTSGRGNTDTNAGAIEVKASIENVHEGGEDANRDSQIPQTPVQGETGDVDTTSGQGNEQTQSQAQNHGVRSVTGYMASAPRRRSRTPGKPVDPARNVPETLRGGQSHTEQRAPSNANLFGVTEEELLAGPIRRPALRRSPPAGSQSQSESQTHSQPPRFSPNENPDTGTAANIGIVRKPALRRSPPTASQSQSQSQRSAEKIEIGPGPIRKSALRGSPASASSQIHDQMPSQPKPVENQTGSESQAESELEPNENTPTHARHGQSIARERDQDDGEPELPPTPVQRGLEDPIVTTPPTGIHDTPSKRKSKKASKPSPLKQQSQAFSASLGPKPLPKPYAARSAPLDPTTLGEALSRAQDEDLEMTGVSRHGPRPPPDKYATKRKLRDKLLQELQELQADVSLAESENERLYNLHESGNEIVTAAQNQSEIEELLKRSGYGNEKDGQEVDDEKSRKPLTSFHALSSFLPFSAPLTRQPPPTTTQDEDPIPSHLPIAQEDPLPYLQLFTPLEFSSVITVAQSSSDPDTSILSTSTSSSTEVLKDIIQFHTITARSPGSSSLFRSTVSILVNTTTFSITSIKIDSLSPAAEPELGSFINKIANASNDDVLAGNAATLFWAMGRWYEVAKKRAIFWVRVEEEFGPKSDFATRPRKSKGIRNKKGRNRKNAHGDTDGGNGEEDAPNNAGNAEEVDAANNDGEDETYRKLTRKEYLSNMGRKSTILSIPIPSSATPDLNLRIEWKIDFDWTGEVENSISVGILGGKAGGWPASCKFFFKYSKSIHWVISSPTLEIYYFEKY